MPRSRPNAALIALIAAMTFAGCGEKDQSTPANSGDPGFVTEPPAKNTERPPARDAGNDGRDGTRSADDTKAAQARQVRMARRIVRMYIEAIDARDGDRLCELLAPKALEALKLPRPEGSCADSLNASIGFADKRGFPVFKGTTIVELVKVALEGEAVGSADARVTATLVTEFRDRAQPSVEDDFIYLVRSSEGEFQIAKASSNLFRAVGRPDIPPSVISPPD